MKELEELKDLLLSQIEKLEDETILILARLHELRYIEKRIEEVLAAIQKH